MVIITNIVLAAAWSHFVWKYVVSFQANPAFTTLLFLILESTIVVAFLFRTKPASTSSHPFDLLCAVGAIAAAMFFLPLPGARANSIGSALLVVGAAVAVLGMFSLGRSFSILPANRGIQNRGLYKIIRHPIYAGYVLTYFGYTMINPSGHNVFILGLCLIFLVLRIFNEEKHLSQDPVWISFSQKTRWKLVPYVF